MVVLRGGTHIDNDEEERSARVGTYSILGSGMPDRMAAETVAP